MWDAMLAAAENTGLALRMVKIPLEDSWSAPRSRPAAFAKAQPEGSCPAIAAP